MNSEESDTRRPMRRMGLIDQVAERFRQEIVSGRWPVGQRIPTEPVLVEQSGAGRNTVREALQSLVHSGLLVREQGRGTFVISDSELAGSLQRQLTGGTRRHYLELRYALDSTAAALAAANRTEADIENLRKLCENRQASWSTDDDDQRTKADLALHRAIVEATHNPLFVTLYSSMLEVFVAQMRGEENPDEDAAHRRHRDLVEAIADQDAERATAHVAAIFSPFME